MLIEDTPGNPSSTDDTRPDSAGGPEDETTVIEPEQGNGEKLSQIASKGREADSTTLVLSHIISQLRPGADLSRVTLPTFILEPRSMLERITKCVWRPHLGSHDLTLGPQFHGAP